ncbi:hypothetical protein C8J57DRAFT_722392, partial [Mycena rebaudengoi]
GSFHHKKQSYVDSVCEASNPSRRTAGIKRNRVRSLFPAAPAFAMQFTFASLQVFVIAGIMLQFAAGSPIGLNKHVDTSVGEDGDKLLWLSEPTKPSKRVTMGQVDTHVGEDGDKLLWLSEPTKPSKRVTMGEDGEPGLDWLNNLVPAKRTIVEDGEPGLDWLNNLAPAKRDKVQDRDAADPWGDFVVRPASS